MAKRKIPEESLIAPKGLRELGLNACRSVEMSKQKYGNREAQKQHLKEINGKCSIATRTIKGVKEHLTEYVMKKGFPEDIAVTTTQLIVTGKIKPKNLKEVIKIANQMSKGT